MPVRHLLIVVTDLGYFISHRLPIAIAAKNAGYIVSVGYGELGRGDLSTLSQHRIRSFKFSIQRGSVNPLKEFRALLSIFMLFRRVKPSIVHLVALKPVIYGGLVARVFGSIPVVSAIAGMGALFINLKSKKYRLLRLLLQPLLRVALSCKYQRLVFQNFTDLEEVLELSGAQREHACLIKGAGIDITNCQYVDEPSGLPTVTMASRLLFDKGVSEFCEAAEILKLRGVRANFLIYGEIDVANPESLVRSDIVDLSNSGVVRFLGFCKDIISVYQNSNLVVLPSYREGLPRSLVEAGACGRAVITTDVPGCRDAIIPGSTGLLVNVKDSTSLANAIEQLLQSPDLRKSLGKSGRRFAEKNFDIRIIVRQHLKLYDELTNLSVSSALRK